MTKQEEIREGIADWFSKLGYRLDGKEYYLGMADEILTYLHSKGVAIKVDRELPKRDWHEDWGGESGKAGYELALEDMASYVAVEPLIEG